MLVNRRHILKAGASAAATAAMRPSWAREFLRGAIPAGNTNGLGIHLNGITVGTPQLPFLNLLATNGAYSGNLRWGWSTHVSGGGDTGEEAYIQYDEYGWPTAVTASGRSFNQLQLNFNFSIQTASYTGIPYPAHAAPGYTIQGEGAGSFELFSSNGDIDASSCASSSTGISISGNTITSTSTSGIWVVTFGISNPKGGVTFILNSTDPESTGNYLRNIQIFESQYAANVANGEYFNPNFISAISQFNSIRLMDWLMTNNSTSSVTLSSAVENGATSATLAADWSLPAGSYPFFFDTGDIRVCTCTVGSTYISWSGGLSKNGSSTTCWYSIKAPTWATRATLQDSMWGTTYGVPWELGVALANAANTNLWINIPPEMQLSDIESLASYIATNLNPGLIVHIEYGNEVWNTGFHANAFVTFLGEALWPDYATRGYTSSDCRCSYMALQLSNIYAAFEAAFGSSFATRVKVVCGGQSASTAVVNQILLSALAVAEGAMSEPLYEIGTIHICIAPYFGTYDLPIPWLTDSQSTALTAIFDQINSGGQIPGDGSTSWLSTAVAQVTAHVSLLAASPYDGLGMQVMVYESGQSLVGASTDSTLLAPARNGTWNSSISQSNPGYQITDGNGHPQLMTTAGTVGATEPTWNETVGGTTNDGTVVWTRVNNKACYWQADATYVANQDACTDSNGRIQVCTTAGTSGASAPTWATTNGATTTDGTVIWTLYDGPSPPQDEWTALLAAANVDSRMGTAYTNYYGSMKTAGAALMNAFVDISQYEKFGNWGACQSAMQIWGESLSSTPFKWQAIVNFSKDNPKWWK